MRFVQCGTGLVVVFLSVDDCAALTEACQTAGGVERDGGQAELADEFDALASAFRETWVKEAPERPGEVD